MKHYPVTFSLFIGACFSLTARERPHIIIIYVDDMAYADLSCYGGEFVETSQIDKLAKEGIRFTQYYSMAPVSSPSRVSLMTGMYPTRWGIRTFLQSRDGNRKNLQNDYLSDKAPSLARALKQNGYATAHFGKWHMGGGRDVDDAPPIRNYGFDESVSTWESPYPDKLITASDWIWSDQDSIKRWDRTAYFVDKTLAFISKNRDKPCFINLWPDDVHTPFVPHPDELYTEKDDWEKREAFIPVLKNLDEQIGRLVNGLKMMGEEDHTMIIFTSDNGPNPSYGAQRTKGLRGKKGTLYEGGIRMPFIVRWPSVIQPSQVNTHAILASIDLLPTLCRITETPLPVGYTLDGEERSDIILGNTDNQRDKPLFWEFSRKKKNDNPANSITIPQVAVRWKEWKLLVFADGTEAELFHLINDPGEKNNVADQHRTITDKLAFEALQWFRQSYRELAD